jgi:hypothetical protein
MAAWLHIFGIGRELRLGLLWFGQLWLDQLWLGGVGQGVLSVTFPGLAAMPLVC